MTKIGCKACKLSNDFLSCCGFKDDTIYLHEYICGFVRVCACEMHVHR